jgi:hypothetical protein
MAATATRDQVLSFRVRTQQLDRDHGTLDDTAVLDLGVQDTGPDGARWALAMRGVDATSVADDELSMVWTLRGAPHLYRRSDLASVAAAVAPVSDADAGHRIYDAAKPLKAAGIGNLQALDTVADAMRSVVTQPTVKGEVSAQVSEQLGGPYVRFCRPCNATHVYEMPFRLGAFRGGLELQPGTSPPVLRRIRSHPPASRARPQHDVIRAYLHLLGPATPKQVSGYVEAPVKEVTELWPSDVVEVTVDGQTRWVLEDDQDLLGAEKTTTTRLLGPFDLFLQARDRDLLVPDPARAKALWPVLGRPGAVLEDGQIVGLWRPRSSAKQLTLNVELWGTASAARRKRVSAQAGRLATYRGVALKKVDFG